MKMKSLPAGIVGVISGAFMIVFSIIYFASFSMLMSMGMTISDLFSMGFAGIGAVISLFTYPAAAILGLIGGIVAFKNNKTAAILLFIATGFALFTGIFAIAWLAYLITVAYLVSAIVALTVAKPVDGSAKTAYQNPYQQSYQQQYNPYAQQYQNPYQQPRQPENKDDENK